MTQIAVKFCGGCNPGYDRGAAYQKIREAVADCATVSLPQEGCRYDALLIIRGCTGCPYLYEEIDAGQRILCVKENDIPEAIAAIRSLSAER